MPDPSKKITLAALSQLQASGAQVKREPREVVVNGLQNILQSLSKHDDSVLIETLSQLISVISEKETSVNVEAVNFEPLVDALKHKPSAYRFEIKHNDRGRMSEVLATPIGE